jgi:phospholipase C
MPTKTSKIKKPREHGRKRATTPTATRTGKVVARKAAAPRKSVKATSKKRLAAASVSFAAVAPDATLANLDKIEHIVVLMMENRSFDHLLGYLTIENGRTDVDGLTKEMHNTYKGVDYFPKRRTATAFGKKQDPCHAGACVAEQLINNNGGFVSNYAGNYPADPEVDLVMNYYDGATLKVYDRLVNDSVVCDRWFCSLPGQTWPNRLYSVTGQSGGTKDNKKIPIYDLPSFVRHLSARNISWRWYAHHAPATLRLIDSQYRPPLHLKFDHFSYFDRHSELGGNSFLEDAAQGKLASVSWIDPDFGDPVTGPTKTENDDHPPVDVMGGQELVLKLYNAVTSSPQWEKTLLVILYDEHGGLYDHVPPPSAEDDRPSFRRYGVRVPAFVVSPWAGANKISHVVFDHTSLIKTILLKFCRRPDGSIPDMGARVNAANHLGVLLTRTSPRPAPTFAALEPLVGHLAAWRGEVLRASLTLQAAGDVSHPEPNELQEGVKRARQRLRAQGLPEGQP